MILLLIEVTYEMWLAYKITNLEGNVKVALLRELLFYNFTLDTISLSSSSHSCTADLLLSWYNRPLWLRQIHLQKAYEAECHSLLGNNSSSEKVPIISRKRCHNIAQSVFRSSDDKHSEWNAYLIWEPMEAVSYGSSIFSGVLPGDVVFSWHRHKI